MGCRVRKLFSDVDNLICFVLQTSHRIIIIHLFIYDIRPRGPLQGTEMDEKVHSWMSSGVIQIFVVAVAVTTLP